MKKPETKAVETVVDDPAAWVTETLTPSKESPRTLADIDADIQAVTSLKAQAAAERDAITTRMAQDYGKKDHSADEAEYQKLWLREEVQSKRLEALHIERRGALFADIQRGYTTLLSEKEKAAQRAAETTMALKLIKQENKDRLDAAEAADRQASAAIHALQRQIDHYITERAQRDGLTEVEYRRLLHLLKGGA